MLETKLEPMLLPTCSLLKGTSASSSLCIYGYVLTRKVQIFAVERIVNYMESVVIS